MALMNTVYTGNASYTWKAIEFGLELVKKGIIWRSVMVQMSGTVDTSWYIMGGLGTKDGGEVAGTGEDVKEGSSVDALHVIHRR